MQGYDKFFKAARKASQSGSARQPSEISKARKSASGQASKRRFKIPPESMAESSPEKALKQLVAERIRQKRDSTRRARAPFPTGPFLALVAGLAVCASSVIYPESVDWVLGHVEIGVFGDARAAGAAAAKPTNAAKPAGEKSADAEKNAGEKPAAGEAKASATEVPDTRQWTPEELSFFNKLNERKRELDLREAELTKLEEELQKQKGELDEKIKQLEAMRAQIAQTLKTRVDTDQEKVSKLVEVYAGMKPQQAAKVIETINEDLAVQILDRMKKKSAADILNVMDAGKAQRLSEMLAGYKRP